MPCGRPGRDDEAEEATVCFVAQRVTSTGDGDGDARLANEGWDAVGGVCV